jgi:predicted NUDIX family phosphoesterase
MTVSVKDEEQILVVPTDLLHSIGYFQGFCAEPSRYARLFEPVNLRFARRGDMESNPDFKQLIPYMLFTHRDPDGCESVFSYVRGRGMGESRLHNLMSVGVGGHINETDYARAVGSKDGRDIYREGLLRELHEEVVLESSYVESCVGLINDDQNEVGKVHLGIVHRFELEAPCVTPKEPDLIESGFYDIKTLLASGRRFETWTEITLRALYGTGTP